MMKKPIQVQVPRALLSALLTFFLTSIASEARMGVPPRSHTVPTAKSLALDSIITDPINPAGLKAQYKDRRGKAHRFAQPIGSKASARTRGTWEALSNGGLLWRLKIQVPNATDLNFGFGKYNLPDGATLYIDAPAHRYYQGPYTSADNKPHGQFWTPVVPGDTAILELYTPPHAAFEPELELIAINGGFRDMFSLQKEKQGACNIDIICPEADPYRDIAQAVGAYTVQGIDTCTGTMIMDAESSFRSWFLTAAHCGLDNAAAASMVVYWNFFSPNCGDLGNGNLNDNQSGASFRMSEIGSDVSLVELDEQPDEAHNVYYAGWSRTRTPPASTLGIHHPNVDEKAICFDNNPPTLTDHCATFFPLRPNTHWECVWDRGVTEPGSSGSGLFDQASQRLIGVLTGGGASCTFPDLPDCYGIFDEGWDNTSSARSLRNWLDPNLTDVTSVDGSYITATPPPGNMVLAKPLLQFPSGGEVLPGGAAVSIRWDLNGNPDTTTTMIEFSENCGNNNVIWSEDVESGFNGWSDGNESDSEWYTVLAEQFPGQNYLWYSRNTAVASEHNLVSPAINLPTVDPSILYFWHAFDFQSSADGGVVEISVNGADGPWIDLGPNMQAQGYNGSVGAGDSVIAGRQAFVGENSVWHRTSVSLAGFEGRTIHLRFQVANSSATRDNGWWIDDISIESDASWQTVGLSQAGAESFPWTTPDRSGTSYCIRLRSMAPGYEDSDYCPSNPFSIFSTSDNDGMRDAWEWENGLNPRDPADAQLDKDGDGFINLDEFLAGTDPSDPTDYLSFAQTVTANGKISLTWKSKEGTTYNVLRSKDVQNAGWVLDQYNISATPPLNVIEVDPSDGKFFQLQVVR